jgi:LmbE family N-acetylglucosaminyl deacetylase
LGLHRRTLPLPDAIYRGNPPLYPEEADLFGFIHTDDARELEPRLLHLFEAADKTGTLWLFPSGIGRHVDHQILRRVGERLGSGGRAVLFYAELPYASRRGEEKPVALEMVQPPPGWRDLTVDIEDALPRKVEAASAYRSQLAGLAGETNGSLLLPRWESFLGPEELILVLLGQGGGGPAGLRA